MGNPYHDPDNGQFTTKAGAGGGGGGDGSAAGTMNAADAKGKGVDKMWGVRPTGRMVEVTDHRTGMKTKVPEYDFSERAKYVNDKLEAWRNHKDASGNPDPIETKSMYSEKVRGKRRYLAWRRKEQKKLMNWLWDKYARDVPNEGKAILSGGLGGSGKGTKLEQLGVPPDSPDYFTINVDDIKEEMARRGMIPQIDPKMTPMELSPLAHEEAGDMAMALARRAYKMKKNVVWDFTMASQKSVLDTRVDRMRTAGYTDIQAVFVDVSVDKSVAQAERRWHGGMIRYGNNGDGYGGRFLPSGATDSNRIPPGPESSKYRSKNRKTFEETKGAFDGYIVYDNEDGSRVVEEKNFRIGKS